MGKFLHVAISDMSLNHSFREDLGAKLGLKIAGEENFIPIDFRKSEGRKIGSFNPKNFEPMKEALDSGKSVVIAAHNPTAKWKLPQGGYGAAYLGEITENSIILPVTVNVESDTPVGIMDQDKTKSMKERPNISVYIGEPIELQKIPGVEDMARIMEKRTAGKNLTPEERQRFSEVKSALQEQSDVIMNRLSLNLPESKRGEYAESH